MKRPCLAALVTAALVAAPGAVTAQPPSTRLAGVVGGRLNVGDFGERYRLGMPVFGIEASYHPLLSGHLGLVSYVIASAQWEGEASELNTAGDLWLVQMGLGPRLRFFLGSSERAAVYLEATGEILRANYTIPPSASRTYLGPSVGLGVEIQVAERWIITIGGRYGLLVNGPGGLAVHTAFGYGE